MERYIPSTRKTEGNPQNFGFIPIGVYELLSFLTVPYKVTDKV